MPEDEDDGHEDVVDGSYSMYSYDLQNPNGKLGINKNIYEPVCCDDLDSNGCMVNTTGFRKISDEFHDTQNNQQQINHQQQHHVNGNINGMINGMINGTKINENYEFKQNNGIINNKLHNGILNSHSNSNKNLNLIQNGISKHHQLATATDEPVNELESNQINLNSVIKNRNSNSNDKFEELKTRSEINTSDKQNERHLNQNQQTFQSLNQLNENSNQKNLQKEPSLVPRVIPKPPNSKPQIPKNKPLM